MSTENSDHNAIRTEPENASNIESLTQIEKNHLLGFFEKKSEISGGVILRTTACTLCSSDTAERIMKGHRNYNILRHIQRHHSEWCKVTITEFRSLQKTSKRTSRPSSAQKTTKKR